MAVGRLMLQEELIGSCVCVERGFILTCRHCILEGNKCLSGLTAFGHPLTFCAASPKHDLALCNFGTSQQPSLKQPTPDQASSQQPTSEQPPSQRGWQAYHRLRFGFSPRVGERVFLISYPLTVENTLHTRAEQRPVVSQGIVAVVGRAGRFGTADYSGCMPNSFGGAVVDDLGRLVGLHTGMCYHRDWSCGRGSPQGSSGSHSSGTSKTLSYVEKDPDNLWSPAEDETSELTTEAMAQEAYDNVEHKASLGIFVTGTAINQFMDAVEASKDVLEISMENSVKRAVTRNRQRKLQV